MAAFGAGLGLDYVAGRMTYDRCSCRWPVPTDRDVSAAGCLELCLLRTTRQRGVLRNLQKECVNISFMLFIV